jgi:hypothetical protein
VEGALRRRKKFESARRARRANRVDRVDRVGATAARALASARGSLVESDGGA